MFKATISRLAVFLQSTTRSNRSLAKRYLTGAVLLLALPSFAMAQEVQFNLSSSSTNELVSTVNVQVVMDSTSVSNVTVPYTFDLSGTAVGGGLDYTDNTSGSVTITAGNLAANVQLVLNNDILDEPSETVVMELGVPTGGATNAATNQIHTLTVVDNDPPAEVLFNTVSGSADEDDGSVFIQVDLDTPSGFEITIPYSFNVSGSTDGSDYTDVTAGSVVIPALGTTVDIEISISDDVLDEAAETVVIDLGAPTNGNNFATNQTFTLTVNDNDNPPEARFTLGTSTSNEADGLETVQVEINAVSGLDVTIPYTVNILSSATLTDDYIDTSAGSVTILAGNTSADVQITIVDDATDEPAESLILEMGTPTNASNAATGQSHTLTINDNDDGPEVSFTGTAQSNNEGVGIGIQMDLSALSGQDITVPYTINVSSTATGGGVDFTELSGGSVSILAGNPSGFVQFNLTDDLIDELDETIVIDLGSPTNATNGATNQSFTLTILDNDAQPEVQFNGAGGSAVESIDVRNFQVDLSTVSGLDVTVPYTFNVSSTATAGGVDFTDTTAGSITITAGMASANIVLTAINDTLDETDETIVIDLGAATNATNAAGNQAYAHAILDDDNPPEVSFDAATQSGNEGDGVINLQVNLSTASSFDVTIPYTVDLASTAVDPDDYANTSAGSITILAGATTGNIQLTAADDAIDELDETVVLNLGTPTNGTNGATNQSSTLTIVDNDASPTVAFVATSDAPAESAGATNYTVQLSAASGLNVTIPYTFNASSTAVGGGVDYTDTTSGSVTILAGATSVPVTITYIDDVIDENAETLVIDLGTPTNADNGGSNQSLPITIGDNDLPPEVDFNVVTRTSEEDDGTVSLQVDLSAVSGLDVTVPYTFNGTSTAIGGGTDYTDSTSGSVTVSAGSTSADISIALNDDAIDENAETLIVDLGAPTNGTSAAGDQSLTLTINDNDAQPTVDFAAATTATSESAGLTGVIFNLSAASGLDVTIPYTFNVSSTATEGGAPGADDYFDLNSGSITISAGATSATATFLITDDSIDENDETIVVDMGAPTNATNGTTIQTNTVTIADNDAPPVVNFDAAASSLTEATVQQSIAVSLSTASGLDVTIPYSLSVSSTAIAGGIDYTNSSSGSVTILAGATTVNVLIDVVEDLLDENNETVVLDLGTPTNATNGATVQHTLTINDDDLPPEVNFNTSGSTVAESVGSVGWSATLTAVSGLDVTVPYTINGSSTATGGGVDYTDDDAGSVTIPAGSTSIGVNFTVAEDTLDENSETFVVDMGTPTNGTNGSGDQTVTTTITDNDLPPEVAFNATTQSNAEGEGVVDVQVDLTTASGLAVTVPYTINVSSTAVDPDDYADTTAGSITIPAGATTANVQVTVVDDALDENDETIVFDMGLATNATNAASNQSTTLTITDNDNAPEVSFAAISDTEGEADGASNYTVSLSAVSALDVTVPYTFNVSGTASGAGVDYTDTTSGSITILAGNPSEVITVTIVDDVLDEPTENFVIDLGSPTNGVNGATNQSLSVDITDNDAAVEVQFNAITSGGLEAAGAVNVQVDLSAVSGFNVTVPYSINGSSTATDPDDYMDTTAGTITILAGAMSGNVQITPVDDALFEADETVVLDLGVPTNATNAAGNQQNTFTIVDNDGAPQVLFNLSAAAAIESAGIVDIQIDLSSAAGLDVTVPYTINVASTATAGGVDYTEVTGGSVVITAGNLTGDIQLNLNNDTLDEDPETVIIDLGAPTNAVNASVNQTHSLTLNDDDPPSEVSFVSTASSFSEATGLLNFAVQLDKASSFDIDIPYTFNGSSVASGADYADTTAGSITILAGVTTGNIQVTLVDDGVDEVDESLVIDLGTPTNGSNGAADQAHTLTITDNDAQPEVQFNVTASTSTEDAGSISLRVDLSTVSGRAVEVPYSFNVASTATGGGVDYSDTTAGTITILEGNIQSNVVLLINDDPMDEPDETIVVELGAPNGATNAAGSQSHTVTITDNDLAPEVLFNVVSASTNEGDANALIVVELSDASGFAISVPYAINAPGTTATAGGVDYTDTLAGTLNIPIGAAGANVALALNDDLLDEVDETVELELGVPVNATNSGINQIHTHTILDNDNPPAVKFSAVTSSSAESDGAVNIQFEIDAVSTLDVTIPYTANVASVAQGLGVDYTDTTAGSVTITAGNLTADLTITINDDVLDEDDETLVLDIGTPTNGLNDSVDQSHTLTITDNDTPPEVQFSVAGGTSTEADAPLAVSVTLDAVSGRDVTVPYSVNASSTASGSGVDYTDSSAGSVTIVAGSLTGSATITFNDDLSDEPAETIVLDLGAPTNATNAAANQQHSISLTDNDLPPEVQFNAGTSGFDENDGTVNVQVNLSVISGFAVTVPYSFNGSSTATLSDDYTDATTGSIIIPIGAASGNVQIAIVDDLLDEPVENVVIDLGAPTNGSNAAGNQQHSMSVTDNDDPPEVQFNGLVSNFDEASGTINVAIDLTSASGFDITIPYTFNGTSTAVGSGTDYSDSTSGNIIITAGNTSGNVQLSLNDDLLDENNETVVIDLGTPTNGTNAATNQSHTVTIDDNDLPPEVDFNVVSSSQDEADGTISLQVDLTAASGLDVTIPYTFNASSTAVGAGTDYSDSTAGSITILAGATNGDIQLAINDDLLDENDETVVVDLGTPTNGTNAASDQSYTLTIGDNDEPPKVDFNVAASNPDESDGTISVAVELDAVSGLDVTIPYVFNASSTAVDGSVDYIDVSAGSITISAGDSTANIQLALIDDAIDENDETIIIDFNAPFTNGDVGTTIQQHTVTIADNDLPPEVLFNAASSNFSESDGTGTIAVDLSTVSGLDVTIPYSFNASSEADAGDYTDNTSGSITISAGDVTGDIALSFTDDVLLETAELIVVDLDTPTNGTNAGTNQQHSLSLADEESANGLEVTIDATDDSATEDSASPDAGQFTVTMNGINATGTDIEVSYAVSGTAVNGSDYTTLTGTADLLDGTGQFTIDVNPLDDNNLEIDETVTLTLLSTTNPSVTPGAADSDTVTIADDETVNGLDITVAATDSDANEDGTDSGEFTISMSGTNATGTAITVAFSMSGTAGNGVDYNTLSGSIQIADGQSSVAAAVLGLNDGLLEGDEDLTMSLISSDNPSVTVGSPDNATVTIFDDETQADDDDDGLMNIDECPNAPICPDSDGDGLFDFLDDDDDNDGILTVDEALLDTDLDTVLDYLEPNQVDVDGDGEFNFNDADDDGDGLLTADEVGPGGALDPIDVDSDGIADYLDASIGDGTGTDVAGSGDSDADGLSDAEECDTGKGCSDSDNDTVPNYSDPDDDNDGIMTLTEGALDSDADGIADHLEPNELDTDADGTPNYLDGDDDGDSVTTLDELGLDDPRAPGDVDGDGIPNYLDAADGDGSGTDIVGSGDSDGDGLSDAEECVSGIPCEDNEGDNTPDYSDADDDNDGVPTLSEAAPAQDTDNDLTPDYLDNDDDGDSILTQDEDANDDGDNNPATDPTDLDGDAIADYLDDNPDDGPLADPDNDGLTNEQEADLGTDPNNADSDGDGVNDGDENANGTDPLSGTSYADSDGDLVPDVVEVANGTDANNGDDFTDTDLGGVADYIETTLMVALGVGASDPSDPVDDYQNDSDSDGLPDALEVVGLESDPNDADNPITGGAGDADGDGVPNGIEEALAMFVGVTDVTPTSDFDNDGYPDVVEVAIGSDPTSSDDDDIDGDGIPNSVEIQAGGDPTSTLADSDSDADGIPDTLEIALGTDGMSAESPTANGAADDDGDSITNAAEAYLAANGGAADTDTGTDTDGDGITDAVELGLSSSPFIDATPVIRLFVEQQNEDVNAVDSTLGNAVASVSVENQQTGMFSYDWSASNSDLLAAAVGGSTGSQLEIDPSSLADGMYVLSVSVTRTVGGVASNASTLSQGILVVSAGNLADILDDDQDGVSDSSDALDGGEGQEALLQGEDGNSVTLLLQSQNGTAMRLGLTSIAVGSQSASVTLAEIASAGDGSGGAPSNAATDFSFSNGIYDFEVNGLDEIGSSAQVVIPQTAAIPASAVYRKFDPSFGWKTFTTDGDNAVASAPGLLGTCPAPGDAAYQDGLNVGDFCVQLTIVDGGPNDTDGVANGTIKDPGGVAVPAPVVVVPPPTTGGGGGGGGGGGAASWLLLLMAAPLVTRLRRLRK